MLNLQVNVLHLQLAQARAGQLAHAGDACCFTKQGQLCHLVKADVVPAKPAVQAATCPSAAAGHPNRVAVCSHLLAECAAGHCSGGTAAYIQVVQHQLHCRLWKVQQPAGSCRISLQYMGLCLLGAKGNWQCMDSVGSLGTAST